MLLPGTQEIRRPLLEAFKGEAPRNFSMNEILEIIAESYGLNLNDFSSGDKNILRSRINEAKSDLKKNNLLYNPSGNTYMITNAGTEILDDGPEILSDEYLAELRKKPIALSETLEIETHNEPEILPDNILSETEAVPEIDTESQPDLLTADSITDIETQPEFVTDSQPDSQDAEELPDIETPPEIDSDSHLASLAADSVPDIETSTENEPLPEIDTDSQIDSLDADELPDIETSTDDETLPEIDTDSQLDSLTDDTLPDIETPPEIVTDAEPESLAVDSVADIETSAENDTLPEINAQTEDFAGKKFDEAPEEILDTEEVYTNQMPEDIYEPDETQQEDLTPETEHEESQPEPEPEEPAHEEEYDSELLAAAIPSNSIDDVIARYNSELADELLMKAAGLPSDRFEMLVIDLLSKMGYFAFQTARYTTESSGSDMIHGVILDNKTGANIYIQARKLYPGKTIGKADIQDFIDELADKGGKGIYATTANFSENAQILAADERLMLIDGVKLANLMIANNFCVNVEKVYEIKSIDTESFSEYE